MHVIRLATTERHRRRDAYRKSRGRRIVFERLPLDAITMQSSRFHWHISAPILNLVNWRENGAGYRRFYCRGTAVAYAGIIDEETSRAGIRNNECDQIFISYLHKASTCGRVLSEIRLIS